MSLSSELLSIHPAGGADARRLRSRCHIHGSRICGCEHVRGQRRKRRATSNGAGIQAGEHRPRRRTDQCGQLHARVHGGRDRHELPRELQVRVLYHPAGHADDRRVGDGRHLFRRAVRRCHDVHRGWRKRGTSAHDSDVQERERDPAGRADTRGHLRGRVRRRRPGNELCGERRL